MDSMIGRRQGRRGDGPGKHRIEVEEEWEKQLAT